MNNIYYKAKQVWNSLTPIPSKTSIASEIDPQKKFINFFQPGPTYYFIFNLSVGEFDFISKEIFEILGYQPNEINAYDFVNKIHPEDQPFFAAFEHKIHSFYHSLSAEKLTKYKFQYTFRVLDNFGNYKNILHQTFTLEYNIENNFTKSLGFHSDISHLNLKGEPLLSFIGMDGEPSYYNVPLDQNTFIPVKEVFTVREKEIMKLVAEGNRSAKIAHLLNISVHTVNTHRKNILKKTDSSNWFEASSKAIKNGWI
ncbi:LuxR C-terminal-related transcriptional regulator [Pedobacter alpinus]|uniref:LuxR C-terminal-related transcriptional regulator n=1 Tax=Pedobacter alpinus TaxID=1590643 RepID=A0ABW5TVW1_9SPHI